jgi:hypothetical protein
METNNSAIFNDRIAEALKANGYHVLVNLNNIEIISKNASSWISAVLTVFVGIVLGIVSGGDPKIICLSVLLVFYPILTYRKHSKKRIQLFPSGSVKQFHYLFFLPETKGYVIDDLTIEMHTYSRSSYTSPFEEGNRDYFLDIYVTSNYGEKLELFHFTSRNEKALNFGHALAGSIKRKLIELAENPDYNQNEM